MKILHIYNDYYPPVFGGMEQHINLICEGLRDKFELEVLVSSRKFRTDKETINGVQVTRVLEIARAFSAPFCPTMPWWLKKLRADILHFHLPCPTAVCSYLLARPQGKVVVTYHSDIVRQKWALSVYGPVLRKFLNRADKIIATSPNYIDSSPFLRCFKNKCVVIPHGIDLAKFQSPQSELLSTGPFILFVGKLRYYKGLKYLIQAMTQIKSRLLIVGRGKEEEKLKALVSSLNLQNKVIFLGSIPESKLPAYYQTCTIFVLPSIFRSEAFGIVQLEAMACGKPLVSTNLATGVPYVNQDGITGIVVPPKNTQALAQAINRLLTDQQLQKKLGANARRRVEKEFSQELMLQRFAKLYQSQAPLGTAYYRNGY